jgi:hypothetical protein
MEWRTIIFMLCGENWGGGDLWLGLFGSLLNIPQTLKSQKILTTPSIKEVSRCWINVRMNTISLRALSKMTLGSEALQRRQYFYKHYLLKNDCSSNNKLKSIPHIWYYQPVIKMAYPFFFQIGRKRRIKKSCRQSSWCLVSIVNAYRSHDQCYRLQTSTLRH